MHRDPAAGASRSPSAPRGRPACAARQARCAGSAAPRPTASAGSCSASDTRGEVRSSSPRACCSPTATAPRVARPARHVRARDGRTRAARCRRRCRCPTSAPRRTARRRSTACAPTSTCRSASRSREAGHVADRRARELRGVAEAAGFRLAPRRPLRVACRRTPAPSQYSLQNLRNEPFTVDTLRLSATNGVVLRARRAARADPPRTFDQHEARGQAPGAHARRASSSTTTSARSTTRRSPRSASRSTRRPRRCARAASSRAARARWRCSARE